jgi:F-type H+-transporting ATPase subunit delta
MVRSMEKVADRYAIPFLQRAEELGLLEKVYKDICLFQEIAQSHNELLNVLDNPTVKNEKKLAILQAIFKPMVCSLTFDLFSLVIHRDRGNVLHAIMHASLQQYYVRKQMELATITTTMKLSGELVDHFKSLVKRITGCKEVLLAEHINPAIQGGFILRLADRQIDKSLASKLYGLKKQFSVM